MVFTLDRDVLNATAVRVVLQIFNVTGMDSVVVKTAPLARNVACVVKTSSILHRRDASKY